eukprot:CAMPEP_0202862208 /NCGR_PEP_ID=MMETSP1391-20130828/3333_1 /ASSEMBLY_ACC=CAM_ASM_000867 /TAXON_ID=1034604 /ORGANISM="Chlamydomonas leiostraca, Strain SAG 11-49" /LENGTH=447 /DNA_ID=CAMNT_0049541713 /DNA_START=90 /DNA_END=1433 /DNA_ORIENTATION=-
MADQQIEDLFGSDSEDEQKEPKEQQAPESLEDDLEDEEPAARKTTGLFGSDDEDDDDGGKAARPPDSPGSDSDREERREQVPTGPPMEIEAPLLPLPPHDSLCLLRATNIVGIQPRAFDPATYEVEEETFIDEDGRERVRLANNAVIRWRMRRLPDGREVRESNARFVRWEDGSLQLLLGDEVLDVAEQDISHNNQYLFALRSVIQGQAQLRRKLALRPASLDSALHKRLRDHVDRRHTKVYKVARHGGLDNPELSKQRREQAEDERIKSREALSRKQERAMSRAYGRSRNARLGDAYLEEEQDWEDGGGGGGGGGGGDEYDYDDGLTAAQRARMSLARSRGLGDDDEDMARRLQAAKRGTGERASKRRRQAFAESDEEEEEEGGLPDEEEEYEFSGDDDDDDDEDGGSKRSKKKAKGGGSGGKESAPAAQQARARRGVVLSDDEDD